MRLGMIGFGEVGYTFAKGLAVAGNAQVYAYDPGQTTGWQGELIQDRAKETGVQLVGDQKQLLKTAEIILGLVPASVSLLVARGISLDLAPGQVYCDLSSASPTAKKEASEIITKAGGSYIDGTIMGSMATYGFGVPLYLSGADADEVAVQLRVVGFEAKAVGPHAGTASAVKLLRSTFTKGIEALVVETFYAAKLSHAEEMVLDSLADTFDQESFRETVNRYLTSSAIHAERRVAEVGGVVELLKEMGVEPHMATGTLQRLQWMAARKLGDHFRGQAPKDFREVLSALSEES